MALAVGVLLSFSWSVLAQDRRSGEGVGGDGVVAAPVGTEPWLGTALWAALAAVSLLAARRTGWFRAASYRGSRDASGAGWGGWLMMALGVFVAQAVGASAALGLAPGADDLTAGALQTGGGMLGAVIAVAAWRALAPAGARPTASSGLRAAPRDLWVGALVCAGAIPLVSVAGITSQAIARAVGRESAEVAHATLGLLLENDSAAAFLMTAAAVVIAAPIAEELLFRGMLQTGLREAGLGPVWGAVGASLAFLAVHVTVLDGAMMPALFVLSVVLGLSYERTGRLGTPVVAHACFNAFNLWASGAAGGAA